MSSKSEQFYEFADFRLDLSEKTLLRGGNSVPLTPKVFETLQVLVENAGHLLEKDELMLKVWQDRFVDESNLTVNIRMLRKALGDSSSNPRFIETVPRRGYRFIAEVREVIIENRPAQVHAAKLNKFLFPVVAVIILGLSSLGVWYSQSQNLSPAAPILSAPFSLEKLSTNGKVLCAVISPDGKNVVYTNGIEGKQSVWLRQLDTGNNVEIIQPSDDFYYGLAISPDGNFLYFVRAPKTVARQFDIYRVSIFGGIPAKIIGEAEGWISMSPDGARISFVRCYYRDDDFCSLWSADSSDGKNETKLVSRPRPFRIGDNEFSPDGRSIAFAVGQSENQANEFGLVEKNLETGTERELTTDKFFNIRSLEWFADQSGLLVSASKIPNKNYRIWQISARDGTALPLTKDSETYSEIGLDREARHLVATQTKQDFHLNLFSLENSAERRILADASSVTFAPNGKIVFSSLMTGNDEIWSVNSDGSQQRQLTNNAADEIAAVVSPDGNSIFFSSNRTGEIHVWQMNADGSDQTQTTRNSGGSPLFISPDGNWVYYHHALDKTLWRVTLRDGEEKLVLDKRRHHFAFSPDGLQVAFPEKEGDMTNLTIVSLADGQIVKTLRLADEKADLINLKWSPDGKSLAYISAVGEFGNKIVWLQPLDVEKPKQVANLGTERITGSGFAISPDGKSFAVVQGGWLHDAVLLNGLK